MHFDHLRNDLSFLERDPRFALALAHLRSLDASAPEGRTELEGDDVFVLVQVYEPAPAAERRYEAHERYLDIQCLLAGEELMYHAPLDRLTLRVPYLPEKDIARYEGDDLQVLHCRPGDIAVFWPRDGHKPSCRAPGPHAGPVKKAVVKIRCA